jgi:hypothetical protein
VEILVEMRLARVQAIVIGIRLGKGVGNCRTEREEDLTTRAGDAGAMPRTACYLVNDKGSGQPRQRT